MSWGSKLKKSLIWTAVLSTSAYLIAQYAKQKIDELKKQAELQKLAEENIKKRFRQNQVDSNLTVLAVLSTSEITLKHSVDKLLEELKASKDMTKEEKLEIWARIRQATISNLMFSVYFLCNISILTRIQMNIIGKAVYLDDVDAQQQNSLGVGDERDFLALTLYFLNETSKDMREQIDKGVADILSNIPMDHSMVVSELVKLLQSIPSPIFSLFPGDEIIAKVLTLNFSSVPIEKKISDSLLDLCRQCRDFISSPDFSSCLGACVEKTLKVFFYEKLLLSEDMETPLISLMPKIHKRTSEILHGQPNIFVKNLDNVSALEAFSALIYTSF